MREYSIDRIPALKKMAADLGTDVSIIAEYVLRNPKFATWSACVKDKHHYGKGGLQQHTWEVCKLSMDTANFYQKSLAINKSLKPRVLFLAALFHDYGKIWDYAPIDEAYSLWRGTDHKRDIHHISRSGIEWTKAVEKFMVCKDIEDAVLHCILSHHGLREWGSPVMPHSREAWMLHHCDSLSARMNDCERFDWVHSV